MKDIIHIHGEYMDRHLRSELAKMEDGEIQKARTKDKSWMVIVGIIAFFSMVVLVNRKIRGEYR